MESRMEGMRQFGLQQMAGQLPSIDLPVVKDRMSVTVYEADRKVIEIGSAHYGKIKKIAAGAAVSDYMFLLTVYYVLLHKLTGATDIIIGTDVAGRVHPSLNNTVGSFVNVLPLRVFISAERSFEALLADVKHCVLSAFDNQDFPIDRIAGLPDGGPQARQAKIIDVHFSFANYLDREEGFTELDFIPLKIKDYNTTQYEFKLEVVERNGDFVVYFVYSRELYEDETIELFVQYFGMILETVLQNGGISIEHILQRKIGSDEKAVPSYS